MERYRRQCSVLLLGIAMFVGIIQKYMVVLLSGKSIADYASITRCNLHGIDMISCHKNDAVSTSECQKEMWNIESNAGVRWFVVEVKDTEIAKQTDSNSDICLETIYLNQPLLHAVDDRDDFTRDEDKKR